MNLRVKGRALAAMLLAFCFAVLMVSGISLYLAPSGRIAQDLDWHFLWLSRDNWMALHIAFVGVFIAVSAFHLFFNWKPFRHYLVSHRGGSVAGRIHLVIAAVVTLALGWAAIADAPPVSYLVDLNQYFRTEFWGSPGGPGRGRQDGSGDRRSGADGDASDTVTDADNGTDASAAAAPAGADLYQRHCAGCHSIDVLVDRYGEGGRLTLDRRELEIFLGEHGNAGLAEDGVIAGFVCDSVPCAE